MSGLMFSRRMTLGAGLALGAGSLVPALAAAPLVRREFTILATGDRKVTVSEWLPAGRAVGLVLFSHGAASSPRYYDAIIGPIVAAGWRVLAPLHVDSKEHPDTARFPGLASWRARLEDFAALFAHVGHQPYVAVGHSYGAMTALVLGGAESVSPAGWAGPQTDGNAKAVVAFSPPPAIPVLITREGYGKLAVPALIETGTADLMPGMTDAKGWHAHLDAYEAAASGGHRYGLVLEGVNHYFGGMICDFTQPGPPQTAGMAAANRIAGLFMGAYGRGQAHARARLDAAISPDLPVQLMTK